MGTSAMPDPPHASSAGMEHPPVDAWLRGVRAGVVRPRARLDLMELEVDDEMILYDPVDGTTHGLNLTAVVLWELCDGTYSLDAIAAEFASAFNIETARALADTTTTIAAFYTLGLLQAGPDGAR